MRPWLAVPLGFVFSVAIAAPAGAGASGDGWVRDGDIGASAGNGESSPGSGGGGRSGGSGGGSGSGCTYTGLDQTMSGYADSLALLGLGETRGPGAGGWYRKICPDGSATVVWIPTRAPAVDPAVLAQQAFDRTTIPLPGIRLNPPAGADQVVNVPTWLWVENFQPVSATASAGPVTVTVVAKPVRSDWSMGTGDSVSCAGAGTPYDTSRPPEAQRTGCSYTYRRSSASRPTGAYALRATTVWHVTWTATGVSASGDFGLVNRSADVAVRVAEIQALHD